MLNQCCTPARAAPAIGSLAANRMNHRRQLTFRSRHSSPKLSQRAGPMPLWRVCWSLERHRHGHPGRCAAATTPTAACSAATHSPAHAESGTLHQREQYEPTRTLYIGGLPWHVESDAVLRGLTPLLNGATHVEVAPLPSARSRAAHLRAASTVASCWQRSGQPSKHKQLRVQWQQPVPLDGVLRACQLPCRWDLPTRCLHHGRPISHAPTQSLRRAAKQAAAAALHAAHLKRRRQRAKEQHAGSLAALLDSLPPPGGRSVAQAYAPLLQGLLMQLSCAGNCAAGQAALRHTGIISCCSHQLQVALRWDALLREVTCSRAPNAAAAGPIALAPNTPVAHVAAALLFDWSTLPAACDPAFGGGLATASQLASATPALNSRALRKRAQVESFAIALLQLLQAPAHQHTQQGPLHVVDFGSGTGNLVVPLAVLFPDVSFTAVDLKPAALQRLQARVQALRLANVQVHQGRIEDYTARCDVVLALHACGAATDHALIAATQQRAAFIVSPCCIGKLNSSGTKGGGSSSRSGVPRPRSAWMAQAMEATRAHPQSPSSLVAACSALARAADFSHHEGHGYVELAALAKANLELDRCMAAREAGMYYTTLTRLLQPQLTAKCDVLMGAPAERCSSDDATGPFTWWWSV